jgi:phage tail sheath gpL-like
MANIGVGSERISRITGYNLSKGNKAVPSQNLPISIAVIGEINTANDPSVTYNVGVEVTSAQQAGTLFGFGSPIHRALSILRPAGGGVGGIPTIVYPIEAAGGAVATVKTITPTGTATGNGTHSVIVAGRKFLNDGRYDIVVASGDTAVEISTKIYDAVNAVLSAPVTAAVNSPVTRAALTAKWAGASSDFNISIDTNGNDLGITYAFATTSAGAGVPAVTTALTNFGSRWNNMIVNCIGTDSTTLNSYETWNGIPDQETPSGRYVGTIMKPAVVFSGSTLADPSTLTSARSIQCTNAICPAPNSPAFPFEAAANHVALYAVIAQNNPHLSAIGKKYPDMPVPSDGVIGVMSDYNDRDRIVKLGCGTVDLVAGVYEIQDAVTTYRPDGEVPPKFRYVRDLFVDFNIRYGYYLLELTFVIDKVIAADTAIVSASNVIKPKGWKQILFGYAVNLEQRALIARASYMQDLITVSIASDNPNRINTEFAYERTGIVIISSTMAFADAYFGETN